MFLPYAIFGLLITGTLARSSGPSGQNAIHEEETPRSEDSHSYLSDLKYMYKVYQECASQDVTSCLKLKLVAALDRAARSYSLSLIDGVTFVKDPKVHIENEQPKSEEEIEATLPRSLNEKDEALSGLIMNKVGSFLESHSLQIKLPSSSDLARSFTEEGRGKKGGKKGGNGMMLLPLILGGTMIPLALGALALLAGKALIISKLALVLAGIIGLKKLLSGGHSGGHDSGHVEVISGGGHHGSGWGRSYDKEQAAKLAYQAYEPKKER